MIDLQDCPKFTIRGAVDPKGHVCVSQYDTEVDESFWHCFKCDQSYTIGGRPAFNMTSEAEDDPDLLEVT